ncbi:hypothetical protein CJF32_00007093 [Rutstroemia sp. NJR-2017a WRK4]|nr:hypothetical protein CJF32_00007093 [Rutstroemia sp. NJR-2017a WRK4]
MKLLSHSVCSSSLNLPLWFLPSLLPRVLASQANAGFTTTKWNPTRGVKFTMAWSGTSDAGLKNITLFDCDSSGNQFAVFGPIASMSSPCALFDVSFSPRFSPSYQNNQFHTLTAPPFPKAGIDGGSFQWIPPTTIPDGTYIVNLVETPNKVNVNGLSFNGDPFAFGNPSANQPQSQTSTTVAPQTLVVTTTPEAEKTTVLAPTTILLVSTQSAEFVVQSMTFSDLAAPAEVTSSGGEIPTASTSAETSAEGSISVTPTTSPTTSPSPSTSASSTPKSTTTFPFISPTPSHSTPSSSSSTQTNPPTSKSTSSTLHPAILAAIIVSITALFLLSVTTSILLYRRRRQTLNPDRRFSTSSSAPLTSRREEGYDDGGKKKNKKGWLNWVGGIWRGREREGEKGEVQNDPMFYDGGKRGWVMRVNSKPVELLSDGKRWL